MMRGVGTGLLAVVVVLAASVLPVLAIALLTKLVPSWPIWFCAAFGVAFMASVVIGCVSPSQPSDDDDSEA